MKTVARRERRDKGTNTFVPEIPKNPPIHNVVRGPAVAELLELGNLDASFVGVLLRSRQVRS